MENERKIPFDPGYAPLVIDSIGQVGYTYYLFSASRDMRVKKINFPNVFRKIENLLKVNIAFYLGCLMWASCIASIDDCELEGNQLLGEETTEEEYTNEINFLIELLETGLNRDCKYYLNKTYSPDERYLPILKTYKDFLILNKGFVACSRTNQIVLPENLKKLAKKETKELEEKINSATKTKNICSLLDYYGYIFN